MRSLQFAETLPLSSKVKASYWWKKINKVEGGGEAEGINS